MLNLMRKLDLIGKVGTCHLPSAEEQVAFEDFRSLFQQLEQGWLRDAGGVTRTQVGPHRELLVSLEV